MKNVWFVLLYFVIIISLSSCGKPAESMTTADCASIEGAKILSKKEKENACIANDVYYYRGEIYTVYNCCVCDYILMAGDCNGHPLCDWKEDDCMSDFFKNAKYLFSIEAD